MMGSHLFNHYVFVKQGKLEFLSITVATGLFMFYLNKYLKHLINKRLLEIQKSNGMDLLRINKSITFSGGLKSCAEHSQNSFQCGNVNCDFDKLRELLDYVSRCRENLDVCVYDITSKQFVDCIINAFHRGVKVRVITDADKSNSSRSHIPDFRILGIPVRQEKSNFIMHHKFIIVDKRILMSGSMNFNLNGAFRNWENVIVTTQPAVVNSFTEMFEELWKDFSPRNLTLRIKAKCLSDQTRS